MPAYTPIYLLPSPALGETADGPAAITSLASRVEREMSTFRSASEYAGGLVNCPGGATTTVANVDVPTSVIGWVTVEAYWIINIPGLVDSITAQVAAGQVQVSLNDVVVRTVPWHTLWSTRTCTGTIGAALGRTAADTTTNVKLRIKVNGGDPAMDCQSSSIYVCQYGAPAVG